MTDLPRVLISRCLGFEACRYDGRIVEFAALDALRDELVPLAVCPEAELGLGIPRPPVQLLAAENGPRMLQPSSGRDLSDPMRAFARERIESLLPLDGALLKSRSPSCALGDAELLDRAGAEIVGKVDGLFAETLRELLPDLPCIDEREFEARGAEWLDAVRAYHRRRT